MGDLTATGIAPGSTVPAHGRSGTSGSRADQPARLRSACAEMESLFLYQLLRSMRSTVEKSDLFGGGRAEELYTDMLDGEIARSAAASGGIGLSSLLLQQLLRTAADAGGQTGKR